MKDFQSRFFVSHSYRMTCLLEPVVSPLHWAPPVVLAETLALHCAVGAVLLVQPIASKSHPPVHMGLLIGDAAVLCLCSPSKCLITRAQEPATARWVAQCLRPQPSWRMWRTARP